jgi:hypothetical protein
VEKKFSLAFKISSCRKLLLAQTKEKFFKQGFSATESKSSRDSKKIQKNLISRPNHCGAFFLSTIN